ncbi:MAG TPA: ABC transporter permease [Rhodoglobus sp.]|nr:ABC transporter permease [Actinomycetota bacterium]HOW00226.1 ABC transporter permease [Rhodoglobus sp.]HPU04183.1 ABC transporter permease [Rhodoglobus sp.]HQG68959.1 ABC transporter permease [Rhodoglobus sp.]
MLNYLFRRLLLGLAQLLGLVIVVFLILQAVPGDPVRIMLGERVPAEYVETVRERLGLNEPMLTQLWTYLTRIVTGDLGESVTFGQSIQTLVASRMEPSAYLITYGLLLAVIFGGVLGVFAAVRSGTVADFTLRILATALLAMPAFWVGLVLALIFGIAWGLFPVSGYQPGLVGAFRTLTLPAIAIALSLVAVVLRTLRSSMKRVLDSEYIEAARARGYSENRVLARHALRNAVTPTISIVAVVVGFLIGGTAVIEQVFSIPGLGSLLVQAVERRDYPVVQAIALLAGTVVIVAGLVADLLQAALDPRVRNAIRNG